MRNIIGQPRTAKDLIEHFKDKRDQGYFESTTPTTNVVYTQDTPIDLQWDYSHIPDSEWDYDVVDTDYGPTYSVISVDSDGEVTWAYFNDHNNVASWGYHGGHSISIPEFMVMPNEASETPARILQEVREYIITHRKSLT